jgi:hypothetical protein
MHEHERVAAELEARLRELAWPLSAQDEAEVQQRVCEYADELKALGLPIERIILSVKRAANRAGLSASPHLPSTAALHGTDKLLVDMVRWCIDRYYGKPVGKTLPFQHREEKRS